ncbi:MAG: DMT family transporter [Arthrobacter sp.]|uniref:Ethidium bromide-methyl viologen resistance protein EmrE n=1 Tax=Arthrobacter rhombi TaxID=71253 RepID=A0A1R4GV37_9MICC|nr:MULTISPECIES: multidrug efflux SMR transporter [Micrococcaceae]MDN5754727.1 multidrug efflux SMR transporter [Micrococcaceae bacterium]MDN5813349.1 multidrug efflux SMR transporter [Micrococcaceae bacterium]MDN5824095.1 multidrug efflux SMR transporter [Micrococcaceae bacterium]MDN5880182.1 multidrug efflux SMR transporter [Micrococcaceae bacterium]MDN5904896.1 multidrug efflux SMR transporter [Micrococcaceae bacterium]
MKKWLLLTGAILTEVTGSVSLKAAVEHPGWYFLTAVGFVVAFVFLAAVLREGMPLGVAYGIWGASGVALTAALSAIIFGEPLTATMLAGMGLIIAGVLTIELGSQRAAERAHEQQGTPA